MINNLNRLVSILRHRFDGSTESNSKPHRSHGILTIDIRCVNIVGIHGSTAKDVGSRGCAGPGLDRSDLSHTHRLLFTAPNPPTRVSVYPPYCSTPINPVKPRISSSTSG